MQEPGPGPVGSAPSLRKWMAIAALTLRATPCIVAGMAIILPACLHAAERPSFDCDKAATLSEKAICASEALARLDREIAALYRERRTRVPLGRLLETVQRQWLELRDRCGADATCLEKEMSERKRGLEDAIARFAKAPTKDTSGFAGAYSNPYGTMEIEAVSTTEFDVTISTAEPKQGRWVCDFSGTGRLENGAITIRHQPDADTAPVVVTLKRQPGSVTVKEERTDQPDYCGNNGYIEGTYHLVKAGTAARRRTQ